MSQPTYVCGTAGCPREGQPTRARRCVACGMAKHAAVTTTPDAAYGQMRAQGPAHLMPPSGLPGLRGKGWKLTATAAGFGGLILLGLRLLFRADPSRHVSRAQARQYPGWDPSSQARHHPGYQHVQGLPRIAR